MRFFWSIVEEFYKAEFAFNSQLCFIHFRGSLSYTITFGKGGLFVFMYFLFLVTLKHLELLNQLFSRPANVFSMWP